MKKTVLFIVSIALLLTALSVSLVLAGCNEKTPSITVHIGEGYDSVIWDTTVPFKDFIPTIENKRPVYFFDEDYMVKAQPDALNSENAKELTDIYVKWVECDHLSAVSQNNSVEPTCNRDGKHPDYLCPICGHLQIGYPIPKTDNHTFISFVEIQPDCTKDGQIKHQECSKCGYKIDENNNELSDADTIIPALGHDLYTVSAKSATCEEDGWSQHKACKRDGCDYKEGYSTIASFGHKLSHKYAKLPTCTESGWNEYDYCENCNYSTLVVVNALGHDLYPVDAKSAICMGIGWSEHIACKREGCTYKEGYTEYPALGHDLSHVDGKEPKCYESGYDTYDYCNRCDYTTYKELTVEHSIVSHSAKDATCTEKGWYAYNTCAIAECDYTTYKEITALGHNPSNWITDKDATCLEGGTHHKECLRCHEELENAIIDPLGHDIINHSAQAPTCTEVGWNAYDECSRCTYTTYHAISPLGHSYSVGTCIRCPSKIYERDGDYIYLGSYPQSAVTDITLTAALSSQTGFLPTANNAGNWTSYGYYIEGTVTDFMWYIDVTHNNEQYRGVYFTSYRPYLTNESSSTENTNQDDNGYNISTVYWFKYEPIKWRILSEANGEALVLCEMIIDSQEYHTSSNNYANSNIRNWLNDSFYNTAFTSIQKELILLTEVENSVVFFGITFSYVNTNDYIFLLSDQEIKESAYGFDTSAGSFDTERQKKATDYTQCQGAIVSTSSDHKNHGCWWLRSPSYSSSSNVFYVNDSGGSDECYHVSGTIGGIVPAMNILLTDCKVKGHSANADCICTKCGAEAHDLDANCVCKNCNGLFHVITHYDSKAPTCLEVGWAKYDVCSICSRSTYQEIHALGHDNVSHATKAPTCTEIGWDAYVTCSRCDYTTYREIPALGHDYIKCICSRCSIETHILNGKYCRHDDYIYFGAYPQGEVADQALESNLSTLAGSLPTSNNAGNWTSYGYYISSSVSDYMWYIDVTHNNEQYRGVYFTSYRPSETYIASSSDNSKQDDNGYNVSTVYWFKHEPIKWRILSASEGEAIILCEMIIDSQEYHVKNNNYEQSNIRGWLNDNFYNTAFTSLQKELILLTEVDNSARSTNPDNNAAYYNSGNNSFTCTNTNDNIFLLSEQEVTKFAHGFNTNNREYDTIRQKAPTAYAQCQGANTSNEINYSGNGWWWLRSPNSNSGTSVTIVNFNGNANSLGWVNYIAGGVVPALRIKLN